MDGVVSVVGHHQMGPLMGWSAASRHWGRSAGLRSTILNGRCRYYTTRTHVYTQCPFETFQSRDGETRLGETIQLDGWCDPQSRTTHVLVGVPEDIGIRANGGRPGAAHTPTAAISALLNFQSNKFFDGSTLGWGGMVETNDLMASASKLQFPKDQTMLRQLTEEVDRRVISILRPIFRASKIPIIIGGGHNNAFGAMAAYSLENNMPLNAINFDPHPDCRAIEGRHSGNGFSYALMKQYLAHYSVLGMYETAANSASLQLIEETTGWEFTSFESWAIRAEINFDDAVSQSLAHVCENGFQFGLEIDVDGIVGCPSSAQTATGWSWTDVRKVASGASATGNVAYMHLCEAAIVGAAEHDRSSIAKAIAHTIIDFTRAHQR